MLKHLFGIPLLLLSLTAQASNVTVGQPLAPVIIDNHGELLLEGDDIHYRPWRAEDTKGRVILVQYLAARLSVKDMYKALNDALEAAAPPKETFTVTAIVNLSDALWGTSGMANSEMKDNKRRYPTSVIVADREGAGRQAWGLREKTGALILLDEQGRVQFFKHGPLSEQETQALVGQILGRVAALENTAPDLSLNR